MPVVDKKSLMARSQNAIVYKGEHYKSWLELCFELEIPYERVFYYVNKGLTKSEAIDKLSEKEYSKDMLPAQDHLGNIFRTPKEMVKAYNIPLREFKWRMENNMSLCDALTLPYKRRWRKYRN